MNAWLKGMLVSHLPQALQHRLKKWYYPHVLARFREDQWPGAAGARRLIRPGDHVVDAGANIGYVTLLLSRWVGPTGRVHSFEPIPRTFDLLSSNVRKLGLTNVRLLPVALSDGHGEAAMEIPRYAAGGDNPYEAHLLERAALSAGGGQVVPVYRDTLDAVLGEDLPRITFVKLDVEGHESAVLRGAQTVIQQARPAFMIEVSGDPDREESPAHQLFAFLSGHGYQAYVDEDGRFRPRCAGERHVDYFFLKNPV